jgi:preprotein translocase subunit Sss1
VAGSSLGCVFSGPDGPARHQYAKRTLLRHAAYEIYRKIFRAARKPAKKAYSQLGIVGLGESLSDSTGFLFHAMTANSGRNSLRQSFAALSDYCASEFTKLSKKLQHWWTNGIRKHWRSSNCKH